MASKDLVTSIESIDKASAKVKAFINSIVDSSSFVETDALMTGKYFDNATEALGEGVITGYATINGRAVHLFAQNNEVLKGSLSKAQADKIVKCMERAIKTATPFISIIDSNGARVGEGSSIMEGYAAILAKSAELSNEVPHLCIVNGVAVGMMATFAASADFTFMSKNAVMSVNSPMYLASNLKSFPVDYKKVIGFDSYKTKSDVAQFTFADEKDLSAKLKVLMSTIFTATDDEESTDNPNRVSSKLATANAQEAIKLIVDKKSEIIYAEDYATDVKCSIAKINGISVGVVATTGDYLSIEGMDKIIDFVNKIESYNLPLVTLVDSLGVNPSLEQELAGFAKKSYELFKTISNFSAGKIGIAFGNAVGYAYTALMAKNSGFDYTLATTKARIAPVSDDVAKAMMLDQLNAKEKKADNGKLSEKYAQMLANPLEAAKDGYIDNVVDAKELRPYISSALLMILGI